MTAVVKGPSRAGYWVSGACLLAVAVCMGVAIWGVARMIDAVDDFVSIRGTSEGQVVPLTHAGKYTVFIEGLGIADEDDIPAVVLVVEAPDGAVQRVIPDRGAGMDLSYEIAGESGARLGSFRVDEPGDYRIRLESGLGGVARNFPTYTLHIGRLDVAGPVVALIGGFVLAGLFTLAAIILFIVTIVRRNSHKRRYGPYPYPYPVGAGGYGPPGAWPPPPAGPSGGPTGWSPPPTAPPPPPRRSEPWVHTNPPGGWTPPSESPPPPPSSEAPAAPPVWSPPAEPPPTPEGGEDDTRQVDGPTIADDQPASPDAGPGPTSDAAGSGGSDSGGSSGSDPGGSAS